MFLSSQNDPANLADQVVKSADDAVKLSQRAAHDALDTLTNAMQDLRHQAAPRIRHAGEEANSLVKDGVDSVRNAAHRLQDSAQHASQSTARYIQDEPVKSILIAAATGAALMALVDLMSRSHHHRS